MGGGLMQLVAYGAQDIYLTGNPQITFFKVVYRRHTNFAMESISQTFNGKVDYGRKTSVTISRNGDLVHKVYVELNLADTDLSLSNSVELGNGFAFIKTVELEIGGQLIDRHYGDWMNIWCELTHSVSKGEQLQKLVDLTNKRIYIPLQFSFCRNPGLAIPLIALQYHEVKLNMTFASETDVWELMKVHTPSTKYACGLTISTLTPMNADVSLKPATNTLLNRFKLTETTALLV